MVSGYGWVISSSRYNLSLSSKHEAWQPTPREASEMLHILTFSLLTTIQTIDIEARVLTNTTVREGFLKPFILN